MQRPFAFKPVRIKTKLSRLVLENIRDALIDGSLKPGDKLPSMTVLAEQMGVGISSIREAVKTLEGLGVLETRQGDGTVVSGRLNESAFNALSLQLIVLPRSPEELTGFREMYESAYTHLAMDNYTPADLAILEEIVISQEEKSKKTDFNANDERTFHLAVLECTHNCYVIHVGHALIDLFLSTLPTSGRILSPVSIAGDHRAILEAFRKKDREALNSVLKKSFSGWEQRLHGLDYVEPNNIIL